MPNRILRDWTDSEKIDLISFQAEVLFTRLMMKADDFGSFHANPKLINSFCFPLKNIRETDITRWLHELVSSGLIVLYEADSKRYLNILNFNQRLRSMKKAFPSLGSNSQTIDSNSPPEEEIESETEVEVEVSPSPSISDPLNKFQKLSLIECAKKYFSSEQYSRARELLCINGHISSIQGLKDLCKEFIQHCEMEGKIERTVDDFAKHFRYWALDPKRLSRQKEISNGKSIDPKVLKQLQEARINAGKDPTK